MKICDLFQNPYSSPCSPDMREEDCGEAMLLICGRHGLEDAADQACRLYAKSGVRIDRAWLRAMETLGARVTPPSAETKSSAAVGDGHG